MDNNNRNQNNNKQNFSTNKGGFQPNRPGGFQGRQGGFNNRPGGFAGRNPREKSGENFSEFYEKVVQVNRVSKKTKGGDKRSLSVLVVVGDKKGQVGVGLGKAADVQSAIRKGVTYAKKHLLTVPLKEGRTIPHQIEMKLGAAKVIMKPAPLGTGVIAGGPVRVVVEACGISDIVSKTLGTKNKASNVYVALEALKNLKRVSSDQMRSDKSEIAEKAEKPKTEKKGKKNATE